MSKHMNDLKFTPGKYDALPWSSDDHPACAGLIYLDVEADDSFISGWVKPEIARLVKAAPQLLALVRKAVDVLQRHAPPDGLNDHDALTELYGIFDGSEYRAAIAKATGQQP